jgi:DNA-binding MarR family transcriptional regulator
MNEALARRARALSDALIDGDGAAAATHRDWLMGEVAAGLLQQDGATLMELRAAVADLAPLADHYGEGGPGERWRAVWELLYAIGQTTRPLEQARLARADTVSGQLLRLIRDDPGIAPGKMAKALGKQANHVSNALRGLIDQGLVFRLPRGREVNYYLSETGRAAVDEQAPARAVDQDRDAGPSAPAPRQAKVNLLYLDPQRDRRRSTQARRQAPGWHPRAAGAGL